MGWPGPKLGPGWFSAGGWQGLLTSCCGLSPGPSRWVILALSSICAVFSGGGVGMRAENERTFFQGLKLGAVAKVSPRRLAAEGKRSARRPAAVLERLTLRGSSDSTDKGSAVQIRSLLPAAQGGILNSCASDAPHLSPLTNKEGPRVQFALLPSKCGHRRPSRGPCLLLAYCAESVTLLHASRRCGDLSACAASKREFILFLFRVCFLVARSSSLG